jgi:hypothetical protein
MVAKSLEQNPDADLTKIGFKWALGVALQKHWPDVPIHEGARWLMEYIDVPHGAPGYDWTATAAKEIALEYASEFGEP